MYPQLSDGGNEMTISVTSEAYRPIGTNPYMLPILEMKYCINTYVSILSGKRLLSMIHVDLPVIIETIDENQGN
jgi:hypothetical protein